MKTLYDISWAVDEPTYRADPAYSQSTLNKFISVGVENLSKLREHVDTEALRMGSAIDTILTGSSDEFIHSFFISNHIKNLSNKTPVIVKTIYDKYKSTYSSLDLIPTEILLTELNEAYYGGSTWEDSKKINTFLKNGAKEFYDDFVNAGNKTILTEDNYTTVLRCVHAIMSNPKTAECFTPDPLESGITKEYQLKFRDTFRGVDYRGMLDYVKTDHINKVVYPYDLKSSGKAECEFYKSFVEYGYSTQARLYWRLLRNAMDRDDYFREFRLDNFRFIVVSKNPEPHPLICEYKDTQKSGTLLYGKNNQIIIEDPYSIGETLYYYEHIKPFENTEDEYDIVEHLKEY